MRLYTLRIVCNNSSVNASLVLTVIGPDRPGLVGLLSTTLAKHSASWAESRMARLANKFAGILHVQVPEANREAMLKSLDLLSKDGLLVIAERSDIPEQATLNRAKLDVVGHDRQGIVSEFSENLARLGVSVDDLRTGCKSAPMSGEMLFQASAELSLPPGVTAEQVRRSLESLGPDLMVDIHELVDDR